MRLHVLGCGDAFGSGGRHQSGYLVEASDRLFLLDCGPTTLLAMKRAGFAPQRLDAIILSHLHGDHFAGIPFFLIEYLYQNPPTSPVTIAGPPDTRERVMDLCKLMYGSGKSPTQNAPFTFQVLHPKESTTVKGIEVFPFRVPHQTGDISLALKVAYDDRRVFFPVTPLGRMTLSRRLAVSIYFSASARFLPSNLRCTSITKYCERTGNG